jgi:hypothetical protein
MKVLVTIIISWFMIPIVIAQDSIPPTCLPKKTLVIRKRQIAKTVPVQQEKEIILVPEEKEIAVLEATTKDVLDVKTTPQKVPAKLPTLAGGDFGLMNIQVYQKEMDLKNWKFVAIEYSVNQYGWVSKVTILKTNDSRLKDVVLRKLKASKWNPAIDQSGQPMEYKMYQQVVIVKDRTYEEDYRRDY